MTFKDGDKELGLWAAPKLASGEWFPTVYLLKAGEKLCIYDKNLSPDLETESFEHHSFKFNPSQKHDGIKVFPSLTQIESTT